MSPQIYHKEQLMSEQVEQEVQMVEDDLEVEGCLVKLF